MEGQPGIHYIIQALLVLIYAVLTEAGEWCIKDGYVTEYCEKGCCGDKYDEHCCPDIVGIVVGCVLGVTFLVGMIVAIVCICHYQKKNRNRGTVIPAGTHGGTTIIQSSTMAGQPYPHPQYGQPPQYGPPPPQYGQPYGQPQYSQPLQPMYGPQGGPGFQPPVGQPNPNYDAAYPPPPPPKY